MHFSDDLNAYLSGQRFSSGLRVRLLDEAEDRLLRSRIEWLEQLCSGRQVVHIGCVDHDLEQARHKLARGKWLHARLSAVSARCLGVDIDGAGIHALREQLGYTDLLAADLLHDPCEPVLAQHWDDFVLAEVLEHIGNPVAFLSGLRERYGTRVKRFIITVPNAFAAENGRAARRGMEVINSDHRFWFTPYTVARVCVDAGLHPQRLIACRNGVVKRRSLLKNWRLARRPLLRNNLILIAHP